MFQLFDLDMRIKKLPKGLRPLDITVSSIGKEEEVDTIENVPGVIRYGSRDNVRTIELKFFFKSDSSEHFRHIRNAIFEIMSEPMYVVESHLPNRRYMIELFETFTPLRYESNQTTGEVTVSVNTVDLPYAESAETERINNAVFFVHGNQRIEPYRQHLKIEITDVAGSNDYFEIRNLANNTYFRINEPVGSGDDILIDGVMVLINNGQALRRTDKTFITLEPGENELVVNGADSANVAVEFRNYYR